MQRFKCIPLAMVLWVGFGIFSMPENSVANPDFTKRTAKKCVYCHTGEWTSGKYTEAGQYFKVHHTFKGYLPQAPATQQNPTTASKEKAPAKH